MTIPKIQAPLFMLVLSLLFFSSCANIQKMTNNRQYLQKQIDSGNYDEAIDYCVKKLRGKNKKKEKFVTALEKAFNKANDRDVRRMDVLKKKGDVRSLEKIITISNDIADRQRLLEPLLPVIDREGYQAEFRFVKVDGIIQESQDRVAAMLYKEGNSLLEEAEAGDKSAARDAYFAFKKIRSYSADYQDTNRKMSRAHDLGKTHIRFRVDNDAPVVLPKRFVDEVRGFGAGDLNSFWNVFYVNEDLSQQMDYEVVMKVKEVDITPESIKEIEYIDRKEVKDGWEYVLDENGNVLKDTLGNDVTIPSYRFVEAFVFETFQYKEVRVSAKLEFVDLRNKSLVGSSNLGTAAVFENYASTYRGDRRALSNKSKRNLGNHPIPFPSTERMLIDAAGSLKPEIKSKINSKRLI